MSNPKTSLIEIITGSVDFPSQLGLYLKEDDSDSITLLGDKDLLEATNIGVFCSQQCPGNLILQTYDLMQHLKNSDIGLISGFHSPMERECLNILLRGVCRIIVCPARGITAIRIPLSLRKPLQDGRLLIVSPFAEKQDRSTASLSKFRNRFVAALANKVFIAHASPGGKTEDFCREVIKWEKPLYTFDSPYNTNLIQLGAIPITPDHADGLCS